ncbi:MAG: hypothetical protein IJ593_06300 [Lachnospiraceae bacterium]|nr:hypothetical protein [Lachnospiraceae bacterium]
MLFKQFGDTLVEELDNIKDGYDARCDLSDIDHVMTKMTMDERLKYVETCKEKDIESFEHWLKIYIAGLIEKVYNDKGIKPPDWVMKDIYKYDTVDECRCAQFFKGYSDYRQLVDLELQNSLPEFRWRNMICDGMFDSF